MLSFCSRIVRTRLRVQQFALEVISALDFQLAGIFVFREFVRSPYTRSVLKLAVLLLHAKQGLEVSRSYFLQN